MQMWGRRPFGSGDDFISIRCHSTRPKIHHLHGIQGRRHDDPLMTSHFLGQSLLPPPPHPPKKITSRRLSSFRPIDELRALLWNRMETLTVMTSLAFNEISTDAVKLKRLQQFLDGSPLGLYRVLVLFTMS